MKVLSFFACYLLFLLLLLLGCSAPPAVQDQTPTETPPPTPAGATATTAPAAQPSSPPTSPSKQREITITSVSATNPVVIEGRARTFENNVVVRLRDSRGGLIRETFTTAQGEMGQHNPFRAEIFVTRDPGGKITAEALEYSAKDGKERSLVAQSVAYDVETIEGELYLPDTARSPIDCTRVFPRPTPIPKSVSMARLLVEALIDAPGSPFPRGSAVNSIALRNGVVTVDFNERLRNVGGSCAAQAIRASVEKTLIALPTVSRVVISAAGDERQALQP